MEHYDFPLRLQSSFFNVLLAIGKKTFIALVLCSTGSGDNFVLCFRPRNALSQP